MILPKKQLVELVVLIFTSFFLCIGVEASEKAISFSNSTRVTPDPSWKNTEKWIWSKVLAGERADLSLRYGQTLNPTEPEGWDESRVVSPSFIETILSKEPWASAVPRQGIKIGGALIDQNLDLSGINFKHNFLFVNSRICGSVNLGNINFAKTVSFNGSTIKRKLLVNNAFIGKNLKLSNAELSEVYIVGTKIDGVLEINHTTILYEFALQSSSIRKLQIHKNSKLNEAWIKNATISDDLDIRDSEFQGKKLTLHRTSIAGRLLLGHTKVAGVLALKATDIEGNALLLKGSEFGHIEAPKLKVGQALDFSESKVHGSLILSGIEVGDNLTFMSTQISGAYLVGAKIGGDLNMSNIIASKSIVMDSAKIDGNVFLREGIFEGDVDIVFVRIGGTLDIRAAKKLTNLNLSGTEIKKEFSVASPNTEPIWKNDALLTLRNTTVDSFQDTKGAWPSRIDLHGFKYNRIYGLQGAGDIQSRGSDWYIDWLARDESYSPQTYKQLAHIFDSMGFVKEAKNIQYAGLERARKIAFEERDIFEWVVQTTFSYLIGYGLGVKYLRSVIWIVALCIIGMIILRLTDQHNAIIDEEKPPVRIGFFYSLDMFLPIITLREVHYQIDLKGFPRYYFYFHRIFGFFIASILAAGISGITKY